MCVICTPFLKDACSLKTYLTRDERVVALLERLARRMPLYLFTNNNRVLTARIIDISGPEGTVSAHLCH